MNIDNLILKNGKLSKEELINKAASYVLKATSEYIDFIDGSNSDLSPEMMDDTLHMWAIYTLIADKSVDDEEYEIYQRITKGLDVKKYDQDTLDSAAKDNTLNPSSTVGSIRILIDVGLIDEEQFIDFIVTLSLINGDFSSEERELVSLVMNASSSHDSEDSETVSSSGSSGTGSGGGPEELVVLDKGATFKENSSGDYEFSIGVQIGNENSNYLAKYVTIKIIVEDANGRVVLSESETIKYIDPKTTFSFGAEFNIDRGEPNSYKVLISTDSFEQISERVMDGIEINNFSIDTDSWGDNVISANITNNYRKKIDFVEVYLVPKDANGKIIGGSSTYVSDLFPEQPDGLECSFEVNVENAKSVSYSCDFDIYSLLD